MGALVLAGEILAAALKHWRAVALGTLIAAVPAGYLAGKWRGDTQGYNRRIAEVAVSDGKATFERRGDDARLQGMSDYDLCVVGLRGSGMPVDACDELRGLR